MSLKRFFQKEFLEAGCDEAGRGCLAGPVFAAAVILNPKKPIATLNDSKKLSEKKRRQLKVEIQEKALAYSIASCSNQEIDKINILRASFLAMHRAIEGLGIAPQLLLIDGNRFVTYKDIPHHCIIKGDGKFQAIAAASILAKTYRDEYMESLSIDFPHYNWHKNKGYPTQDHRLAILNFGATQHHRMTFTLLASQIQLF